MPVDEGDSLPIRHAKAPRDRPLLLLLLLLLAAPSHRSSGSSSIIRAPASAPASAASLP